MFMDKIKEKFKVKSKRDVAKLGVSMIGGASMAFFIGLVLTPLLIGIPIVIFSFLTIVVGMLILMASPFYRPRLI